MIEKVDQLDALYAELPTIDCKGMCHGTCGPIIPMSTTERQRTGLPLLRLRDPHCAALTILNRCAIWRERPLICRLYGVVEDFRCDYGCAPDRYLTAEQGKEMIRRSRLI